MSEVALEVQDEEDIRVSHLKVIAPDGIKFPDKDGCFCPGKVKGCEHHRKRCTRECALKLFDYSKNLTPFHYRTKRQRFLDRMSAIPVLVEA